MKTKVAILILSAFLIVEKGYIDLDRVGGCDEGDKKRMPKHPFEVPSRFELE